MAASLASTSFLGSVINVGTKGYNLYMHAHKDSGIEGVYIHVAPVKRYRITVTKKPLG